MPITCLQIAAEGLNWRGPQFLWQVVKTNSPLDGKKMMMMTMLWRATDISEEDSDDLVLHHYPPLAMMTMTTSPKKKEKAYSVLLVLHHFPPLAEDTNRPKIKKKNKGCAEWHRWRWGWHHPRRKKFVQCFGEHINAWHWHDLPCVLPLPPDTNRPKIKQN